MVHAVMWGTAETSGDQGNPLHVEQEEKKNPGSGAVI